MTAALREFHAVDKLETELSKAGSHIVLAKQEAEHILRRVKALEQTAKALLTSLIERTGVGEINERTGIEQRRAEAFR